jgi:hypothetical protein
MGYGTRDGTRTFEPDNADECFYLRSGFSLQEILEQAQTKWPGISPAELNIKAEHIQTDCLGYDLYDSSDYTNFICITASDSYFERLKTDE